MNIPTIITIVVKSAKNQSLHCSRRLNEKYGKSQNDLLFSFRHANTYKTTFSSSTIKHTRISLTQACLAHSTAQEYQLRPNVTESGCIFRHVIYATYRRSAAIDMTLKYVRRLNDLDVKNDGSFAKKKISDTPQYQKFQHLRENTFEAVLHTVGIIYLNPDTHPFCTQHQKPQNTRRYTADQQQAFPLLTLIVHFKMKSCSEYT